MDEMSIRFIIYSITDITGTLSLIFTALFIDNVDKVLLTGRWNRIFLNSFVIDSIIVEFRRRDPTGIRENFTDGLFCVPTVFLNDK